MIYVVIATCVFLIEMMFWGIRESYLEHRRWVWWLVDYTPPYDPIEYILRRIERSFSRTNPGKFSKAGRTQVKRIRNWWRNSTKTGFVDMFLRIMEIGNSGWWVLISDFDFASLLYLELRYHSQLYNIKISQSNLKRGALIPKRLRLAYIVLAQT